MDIFLLSFLEEIRSCGGLATRFLLNSRNAGDVFIFGLLVLPREWLCIPDRLWLFRSDSPVSSGQERVAFKACSCWHPVTSVVSPLPRSDSARYSPTSFASKALVQQCKNLGHVELHILKVQVFLVVFLHFQKVVKFEIQFQ